MIAELVKSFSELIMPSMNFEQTIAQARINELKEMQGKRYHLLLSEEKRLIGINNKSIVPANSHESALWARYSYKDFCYNMAEWWRSKGFSIRAAEWTKRMNERPNQKKESKAKGQELKQDKHGFVEIPNNAFEINFTNPKHMTHNEANEVSAYLCDSELEAITIHDPTLFEEKALLIKPFWLLGQSAEIASSTLMRAHKKGYSLSLVKYYYALFAKHSEQQQV